MEKYDANIWFNNLSAEAQDCASYLGLTRDDVIDQLKERFVNAGRGSIELRVVGEAPVEVIDQFAEEILVRSVLNSDPFQARNVLLKMSPERRRSALEEYVNRALSDPSSDWEIYRRTAEVLDLSGYWDLLSRLVASAAMSDDEDILEVAEDYREDFQDLSSINPE